jgi:hypothetical protein
VTIKYVEQAGDLVLRQPVDLTGATMMCWLLDADIAKLRAMTQRTFTDPSNGAVEVQPLFPAVMLVCANIARGQSTNPVDHAKGGMPERDYGFWVPCARGHRDPDGKFVLEELVWYQPYLFIDNEAAFVVGRETYGFRKYIGDLTWPEAGEPSTFTVDTLLIKQFSPEATGKVDELFRLDATGLRGTLSSTWDAMDPLIELVVRKLRDRFSNRRDELAVDWEFIENEIRDMIRGEVPMVFLRQFRSIAVADEACYQAITRAPCLLRKFHGAGIARAHLLSIHPADSCPLVADLGLAGPTIDTGLGLWLGIDFLMDVGANLWEAGSGGSSAT